MYDNLQDAARYLNGTICYWQGEPFYVDEISLAADGRAFQAVGRSLPLNVGNHVSANIADPGFNAFKYQLGYCNQRKGQAIYITRRPARIQSQGLISANLAVNPGSGTRFASRDDMRNWVNDAGFVSMLKGEYPTMEEARAKMMADKDLKSIAFDKHICLRRHDSFSNLFYLSYKGEDISWSEDGAFVLPDEYTYLTESCQPKGCLKAA